MTPNLKTRAKNLLALRHAERGTDLARYQHGVIALLQELVNEPEPEPVARVTGYYGGYLSIATVDGRVLPAGTALYAAPPHQSEQYLEMVRDAERLNWILPFVSGEDSQTAYTRTFLLAHQLPTGKTGKTAIDAAIAAEKGGTQ